MIYTHPNLGVPLTQGDILDGCPLLYWTIAGLDSEPTGTTSQERVVVLTQACDLANAKTTRVQVAIVHEVDRLVSAGILKAQVVKDQVRRHRVIGWYFLPADEDFPESIIDLRDIHTLPRTILERQIGNGSRLCSIATPHREHLAQHFAVTYSRIALPEPYETQAD
ncbi:MAG: hypothetical protein KDA80_20985 [Planctomycetaceae bacterium]|nr:hypothetical protein [Planctomycetaceae bacterium]